MGILLRNNIKGKEEGKYKENTMNFNLTCFSRLEEVMIRRKKRCVIGGSCRGVCGSHWLCRTIYFIASPFALLRFISLHHEPLPPLQESTNLPPLCTIHHRQSSSIPSFTPTTDQYRPT
jgi:hypothetical protein